MTVIGTAKIVDDANHSSQPLMIVGASPKK
jgi:hypothetical protein